MKMDYRYFLLLLPGLYIKHNFAHPPYVEVVCATETAIYSIFPV